VKAAQSAFPAVAAPSRRAAATFRHDSPGTRPIGAAGRSARPGEILIMDTPSMTPATEVPPQPSRWDWLANWLALAMLLAGSVVWPR
jgi:hypothetical protein